MSEATATLRFVLKAKDEAGRTVAKVRHEIGSTSSGMGKLKKAGAIAAVGFAAASGAALALYGALRKCVGAFSAYVGEIGKINRITGLGEENTSKLVGVTRLMGLETGKVTKGVTFFAKNLYAAQQGTKGQLAAFKALGVGIKDTRGKMLPLSDVMNKARDAIASMPAGAQRTALAMKLFGKGGADLLKWLTKSPEDVKKLTDKVKDLGGVFGKDALDKLGKYKEQQHEMGFAWEMIKVRIGMAVIPAFTKVGTVLLKGMTLLNHFVLRNKTVQAALGWVADQIGVLVDAFKTQFAPVLEEAKKTVAVWVKWFRDHWGTIGPVLYAMLAVLKVVWANVKVVIVTAFKVIAGIIKVYLALWRGDWSGAWNALKGIVRNVLTGIKTIVSNVGALIGKALAAAWEGIKGKARSAWIAIHDTVGHYINLLLNALDKLPFVEIKYRVTSAKVEGPESHGGPRRTAVGGGAGRRGAGPTQRRGGTGLSLNLPKPPNFGGIFKGLGPWLFRKAKSWAYDVMASPWDYVTGLFKGGGATGSKLLSYASRFLGVPYLWGGVSPAGFDCSGFTQYVYRAFGINLPRVASAQARVGRPVAQPGLGDLVFFGRPVHHVGIYAGNGKMIDAPHTGARVRYDPLWSDFSGARRVLPGGGGEDLKAVGGSFGGTTVTLNNCTLVGSGPDSGRAIAKVLDDYYRRKARGA